MCHFVAAGSFARQHVQCECGDAVTRKDFLLVGFHWCAFEREARDRRPEKESCCAYTHIYELEISFGLESGCKTWLKQSTTVCTRYISKRLPQRVGVFEWTADVDSWPSIGRRFYLSLQRHCFASAVSLLRLVCAARSCEWAVKCRLRANEKQSASCLLSRRIIFGYFLFPCSTFSSKCCRKIHNKHTETLRVASAHQRVVVCFIVNVNLHRRETTFLNLLSQIICKEKTDFRL